MSLVLLGCADQLIFYFYVVKYNSLDPLCSTIFHCAIGSWIKVRLFSPENLNAAKRHPKVPPPIKVIDKMTTQTLDLRGSS